MDIHEYDKRVARLLTKLESLKREDKEDILNFKRQLVVDNISPGRVMKYLYTLKTISQMTDKPLRECVKEDLIGIVENIQRKDYTEWTKTDFKKILKIFFKWLRQTENYPNEVKWIKTNIKNHKKLPSDLLTKEEVEKLANATDNIRDKAFVLTLFDSGARVGEFLPLKIKDIIFDEYGCVILVRGKTEERRIRLLDYSKELLTWLQDHPQKEHSESFVWCEFSKINQMLSYSYISRMLRSAKKKSEIVKQTNPHAFRHARASILATKLSEQTLKKHFGWTNSSKMLDIYISIDDKQMDEALLKNVKGMKPKEGEIKKIDTKICQKCNEHNTILSQLCVKCGTPFDIAIIENQQCNSEFETFVRDFLIALAERDKKVKKIFRAMIKERKLEHLFKTLPDK